MKWEVLLILHKCFWSILVSGLIPSDLLKPRVGLCLIEMRKEMKDGVGSQLYMRWFIPGFLNLDTLDWIRLCCEGCSAASPASDSLYDATSPSICLWQSKMPPDIARCVLADKSASIWEPLKTYIVHSLMMGCTVVGGQWQIKTEVEFMYLFIYLVKSQIIF